MESRLLHPIRNLSIGHGEKFLCTGISFDICKGDCIMLCGANGSGKTTLMKSLAGLSGTHTALSEDMVMIPARIPKVSGFTLREFVRISCFNQSDMAGRLSPVLEAALGNAIDTLNLSHLAGRDISTLSDGEFQKAGLASALVRKASVILLDEPTAFLDAENRISVLKSLREICDRRGMAVIFSTHDLHDGLKVCTKVIAFGADGKFRCSDGNQSSITDTASTIFSSPGDAVL